MCKAEIKRQAEKLVLPKRRNDILQASTAAVGAAEGSGTNSFDRSYSYWGQEAQNTMSFSLECFANKKNPGNKTHHVESDFTTLPDDARNVTPLTELFEHGQTLVGRDPAERLGRLVSNHVFLVRPRQDLDQRRDRIG